MSFHMNERILGIVLSVLIAISFSWLPAKAEVEVSDTVSQTSDVVSTDETVITEDISLSTTQETEADHSAASSGMVTGRSIDNQVSEAGGVVKSADIRADSLRESTGIISINQAPGTLNNQGTSVNVSFAEEGADSLQATSALQNYSSKNEVTTNGSKISNTIGENAFSQARGIVTVNQSAGSINTQSALVNISFGFSPVVSLSEIELGMQNTRNNIVDMAVSRTDTISSFALQGVKGIVSINQSSGCLNNQANVVTISVHKISF